MLAEVSAGALTMAEPGKQPDRADLYIWDFEPGLDIPPTNLGGREKHLVLLERKMLPALAEDERLSSACILLKPVNVSMLQAFVKLAEAEWRQAEQTEQVDTLLADRDALLQYVLQANLRLQEYDQDRTNFLARALHDFRAPLTALYGYCGLLVEGQLGAVNPRQRDLLQRMRSSTRRLSRLASGMFELSVEGRVSKKLRLEEGDIDESVQQALHELAPFIDEKQLAISAQLSPVPEPFYFEPEQMQQLLVNLIENACKFTPKQGFIDICGYPITLDDEFSNDPAEAMAYRVDIRDSGPGLAPDQLTEIFEEYTSYSDSFGRSGGGLGLAICKMIVKSHGGKIWAEACESGGLFSFVLPFRPPSAPGRHGPGAEQFSIRNDKAV
jgi:signal transduction histidine kinase